MSEWSISDMERLFSLARQTIRKRLNERNIKAVRVVGNSPKYNPRQAAEAIFSKEINSLSDSIDPNKLDPTDRKAWFESERQRLKFEAEISELIPAHEVREMTSELVKTFVQPLESLTDDLERKCNLNVDQAEFVDQTLRAIREQLYLAVVNLGGDI